MINRGCTYWSRVKNVIDYFSRVEISTVNPHYGCLAPGERDLGLLGPWDDLRGQQLLEVCCGRGENCVAFAKAGAICTGVDISEEMIARAPAMPRTR